MTKENKEITVKWFSKAMGMIPELVQMALDSVCSEMEKKPTADKNNLERLIVEKTYGILHKMEYMKPLASIPIIREQLGGNAISREKVIKALLHDDAYARIFKFHLPIESKMIAIYLLN